MDISEYKKYHDKQPMKEFRLLGDALERFVRFFWFNKEGVTGMSGFERDFLAIQLPIVVDIFKSMTKHLKDVGESKMDPLKLEDLVE